MMFAFWLSTMMNGAALIFHPPDSIVTISLLFGTIVSPLLHAKFRAASSGGIYFKFTDLSFFCNRRAVSLFKNDIGLPESAIAIKSSVFVFNLMMCPFKSSSDKFAACFISNAADIAITEKLST